MNPTSARRASVRARSPSPPMARPVQRHAARIRRVQQPGDMQQRGFPGPRRGDQRHHLARPTRNDGARAAPSLRRLAAVVDLFDPVQNQRITHSAAPRPGSSAPRGGPERS